MEDATKRFSSRVGDYVKYRPSYPEAVGEYLGKVGTFGEGAVVADVGSGTGLLTELFLRKGCRVMGVEPNAEMRGAGEVFLKGYGNFVSVDGTAEETGLAEGSVDGVVAGQAFHWFEREGARREFARILRKDGGGKDNVALIWNERLVGATGFLRGYEELLRKYATDYAAVDHRQMTAEVIDAFFAPRKVVVATFANEQVFDWDGVRGRLMSSSYSPAEGDERYGPMMGMLREIFEKHAEAGRVRFLYETKVFTGRL